MTATQVYTSTIHNSKFINFKYFGINISSFLDFVENEINFNFKLITELNKIELVK